MVMLHVYWALGRVHWVIRSVDASSGSGAFLSGGEFTCDYEPDPGDLAYMALTCAMESMEQRPF